jgi:hypothetical protein
MAMVTNEAVGFERVQMVQVKRKSKTKRKTKRRALPTAMPGWAVIGLEVDLREEVVSAVPDHQKR